MEKIDTFKLWIATGVVAICSLHDFKINQFLVKHIFQFSYEINLLILRPHIADAFWSVFVWFIFHKLHIFALEVGRGYPV